MSEDLRRVRNTIRPGQSAALVSKGVSFGTLARRVNGTWDASQVEGLPPQSLEASRTSVGPSLTIRPWRQSGTVSSLRDSANDAFNQHLGIQTTERFGVGTDPDRDGVKNEMTKGDVTAVVAFQATLPVPGRVIPNDPAIERAVLNGERLFAAIRCTSCHVPSLQLERNAWIFTEPSPAVSVARQPAVRSLRIDLTSSVLPQPRLTVSQDDPTVVHVPAYTDFKLHDITDPADDTWKEALDLNHASPTPQFLQGNRRFLTKRLRGAANEPPYFHHGLFASLDQAVLAHSGEALEQRRAFEKLSKNDQEAVLAFLQSLQVLPPGTTALVVDEHYRPKS